MLETVAQRREDDARLAAAVEALEDWRGGGRQLLSPVAVCLQRVGVLEDLGGDALDAHEFVTQAFPQKISRKFNSVFWQNLEIKRGELYCFFANQVI